MQRPHIRRSNCNLIRIAHRNNAVCIINIAYIVCINDSTAGTLQEIPYIGSLQKLLQGNISHRIFPTIIQTDLHRPVRCQYMTDLGTLDRVYHILVLDIQHACLYFILPQHRTCADSCTRVPPEPVQVFHTTDVRATKYQLPQNNTAPYHNNHSDLPRQISIS